MLSFLDACATICTVSQLRDIPPGAVTFQTAYTKDGNVSLRLSLMEGKRIAEWVGLLDRDITQQDDPEAALTAILTELAQKLALPDMPKLKLFGQEEE